MNKQTQTLEHTASSTTAEQELASLRAAITKMSERLKPQADTPEAMQASIFMANRVADDLRERVKACKHEWITEQISGTALTEQEAQGALRHHTELLTYVELYLDGLRAGLQRRKELRKLALIEETGAAAAAATKVCNEAAEAFRVAWLRDYPDAAAKIVALLEMERHAKELSRVARLQFERAREAGSLHLETPLDPTQHAIGRLTYGMQPIGSVVQLPGVLGSPFVPLEAKEHVVPITEEYRDWDAPREDWKYSEAQRETMPPMRTRQVYHKTTKHIPVRQDTPFWHNLHSTLNGYRGF